MAGGRFEVALEPAAKSDPDVLGAERCEFLVSANPGQPPRALRKVASGGELSRISLAIEVAALGLDDVGTMVFDEVDSGIGGAVAEVVGQKLRRLGSARQALCVTHLAAGRRTGPSAFPREQGERRRPDLHAHRRARRQGTPRRDRAHARRHRDHEGIARARKADARARRARLTKTGELACIGAADDSLLPSAPLQVAPGVRTSRRLNGKPVDNPALPPQR